MIALFSATGNSSLVARALSPLIGGEEPRPLLSLSQSDLEGQRRIVWVMPVHAWGVPPVIAQVIKRLRFAADVEQYLVLTCGDDTGYADREFRRLLERSGGKLKGAFSVRMPNTYVLLPGMDTDTESVMAQKLLDAPERIAFIAKAIRHHVGLADVRRGSMPWVKSGVLRPLFRRFLMSPRPFHVVERDCKRCGGCSKACPLGNITMSEERLPQWGSRCATCLACYHVCPAHAVAYGRATRHKGQYRAPQRLTE
ncbi:MAG: 4Fe-4S dicluster domain-containing protein [Pseudoflavonifractor sp.]|nr:4Fe-4S dicluster domain-containing protein [Alloprevotella sp.]MCM1117165.1 4Fe-4S dicluster domain-containing protein [Pseudoflavonifractor sp.]